MRKQDDAPTLNIEARVHELQGKIAAKKSPSRKITAPVAVEQFCRHSRRRADPPSNPNEGTSGLQLQDSCNECSDQE